LKVISPDLELFSVISFVSFIFFVLNLRFFVFDLVINFFLSSFLSKSHSDNRFIELSKS
jgi:hypothetical protein